MLVENKGQHPAKRSPRIKPSKVSMTAAVCVDTVNQPLSERYAPALRAEPVRE